MPRFASHSRHRAFTLIEAGVIVAIIGLLAAIILPVFSRAASTPYQATCASNLKKIGLGITGYAQDYDKSMPLTSGSGISDFSRYNRFSSPLRDVVFYISNTESFSCPSTKFTTGALAPDPLSDTSYTGNQVVMPPYALKLSEISHPDRVVMMQERRQRSSSYFSDPGMRGTSRGAGFTFWHEFAQGEEKLSNIHRKGGNLLYADGHVKYRSYKSLRSGDFGLKPDQPWTETNGQYPDGGGHYRAAL